MSERPVLRQSHLLCAELCGEAFRRRYIEGHAHRMTYSQLRGASPHKARAVNLTQKITSKQDMDEAEVTDAARDHVLECFQDNEVTPEPDQAGLSMASVKSQAIDTSVRLTRADYECNQVTCSPVKVEWSLQVELTGYPFDLAGIIDLVEEMNGEKYGLSDLKTAKRKPPDNVADISEQLSLYVPLYRAHFKKDPDYLALDYIIDGKTKTQAITFTTGPNEEREQAVLERFVMLWQCIEKGIFLPCPASHWKCSQAYCEYYEDCKYVIDGKTRHKK